MMTDALRLGLFCVLSLLAVIASLHAWRGRQAYGFYRFIAFEALAVLIVLNAGRWFHDPLSICQLISWALLAISSLLAAHGIHLLRAMGKARERIVEDTRVLVQTGAFRYIRHPLYTSLMLFSWGVFFKGSDLIGGLLAIAVTAFLIGTARSEESFNIAHLGSEYSDYRKRTKMFIPFVIQESTAK